MDYALVGEKLPYTISPEIHKLFGREYGIHEIPTLGDLKTFLDSRSFKGLNITMPYKTSIMEYLDFIDFNAKEVGAINTIVNRHGMLYGYNTDYIGLEYALKKADISLTGKDILILGSGGASKTAKYIAAVKGANSISIVSRKGDLNYDNVYTKQNTQVIINTTPIGTYPNENKTLIDLTKFRYLEAVVDLIYNPLKTRILYDAEKLGLKIQNGLDMLVEQARASENIFSFVDDIGFMPIEKSEDVKNDILKNYANITFTGMAGVGKTTVGKLVAKALGKKFIDTDKLIEEDQKMSIPEIFEKYGEDYFRKLESEIIRKVLIEHNQVISLGGGAILSEDNRYFIKANSMVFNIKRDLDKVSMDGRPLLKDLDTYKSLYEKREKKYIEVSDFEIYNNGIVEETVKEIIENYEKNISTKWS